MDDKLTFKSPITDEQLDKTYSDVVYRQDALDELNVGAELLRRVLDDADVVGAERAKYEWGLGLIESYISDMKELPSAQQEQRWIPVSEKPPELGHRVFFKMWNNDVYIGVLLKLNEGLKITLEPTGIGYVYSFENVIAWMPLPV